jgi:hypothetical protein
VPVTFALYGTGMALSELETARAKKVMDDFLARRRPPPEIRSQLDLGYRISGQSVEIFEVRPAWKSPSEKIEGAVAKATFVRTQNIWRIYWQRADLKWHTYDPTPEVSSLPEFLAVVEEDAYACFWG